MRMRVPWSLPLRQPWWRWPVASLRVYLIVVIVVATVPLGLFTCWLITHEIQASRQQMSDSLQRSASALAMVIEREQVASIEALTILANTDPMFALDAGAFQRLRQKLPQFRPSWNRILVMDVTGRVLMRSDRPASKKATRSAYDGLALDEEDFSSFASPRFTGLIVGAGNGPTQNLVAWTTRISVPVVLRGRTRYVLAAEIDAGSWQSLMAHSNVPPPNGYAAMFDSDHRLIARTWYPGHPANLPEPTDRERQAHQIKPEDYGRGVHKTDLPDGSAAYAAWQRIPASGWAVGVGMSAAPMERANALTIVSVVGAALASVGLGIGLSLLVARRVNEPLRALVSGGPHAVKGDVVVQEIALLRDAMDMAEAQREQANQWKETKAVLTRAQERLADHRHLIELAQEAGDVGFFDHHLGSDRITMTSGLARLLGLEGSALEISVNGWLERIEPDDAQALKTTLRQAWNSQETHLNFKFRTRAEDGLPQRWLASRLVISYDDKGEPQRMIGVMSDVTAQQLIEQERASLIQQEQRARKEAERANRSKDEFLAMLGHELRNPLSAISAATEVLNRISTQNDQGARVRMIITRQTRHLTRLMDDLLDVARVISGKIHLASQPLNLGSTVQRLVNTMRMAGALQSHPLELFTEDAWVDADVVRVEQVVNNLIFNAVKYSPQEQPIGVRVVRHGKVARLQVTDRGPGIAPSLLPHIFELFVQGERTLDRRQGGLGIGLTLVKNLVELHHGRIDVGTSDAGCCFTVDLPLREAPALALGSATACPSSAEHQRSVVVVEDNDDAREALCCMLELKGHQVSQVADGVEGLNRVMQVRPHLALIDIGLPGLSGYDLARQARDAGFDGWLVALSGYGQQQDVQHALDCGFDMHMVKPFDPHVLEDYLRRPARLQGEVSA